MIYETLWLYRFRLDVPLLYLPLNHICFKSKILICYYIQPLAEYLIRRSRALLHLHRELRAKHFHTDTTPCHITLYLIYIYIFTIFKTFSYLFWWCFDISIFIFYRFKFEEPLVRKQSTYLSVFAMEMVIFLSTLLFPYRFLK